MVDFRYPHKGLPTLSGQTASSASEPDYFSIGQKNFVEIQMNWVRPDFMDVSDDDTLFVVTTIPYVDQLEMTTAGDITTIKNNYKRINLNNILSIRNGDMIYDVKVRNAGQTAYVSYRGGDGGRLIAQLEFSTPYDPTTLTFVRKVVIPFANTSNSNNKSFDVSQDGTRLYALNAQKECEQYDLTTAFDLSTLSATGKIYDFGGYGLSGSSHAFSIHKDGFVINVNNVGSGVTRSYSLSTAFDISTVFNRNNNGWGTSDYKLGACTSPDGLRVYQTNGSSTSSGARYIEKSTVNMPTAGEWASVNNNDYVTSVSLNQGVGAYNAEWSSDGKTLYVTGDTGKIYRIGFQNKYDPFGAREIEPIDVEALVPAINSATCVRISADGTKAFIANKNDAIYQFTLTTPHELTSLVYDNVLRVENMYAFDFSKDGTRLYFHHDATTNIYERVLDAAFDLTANVLSTTVVNNTNSRTYHLELSPDNLHLWTYDPGGNRFFNFKMETPADLTTAIEFTDTSARDYFSREPDGIAIIPTGKYWLGIGVNDNPTTVEFVSR